jgi:soluble epoxide hydrolase/lipid-phosphate phosphatase
LFIGARRDPVCVPVAVEGAKPYCKDLVIDEIDSMHWMMREKPDELNQKMEKWLKEKFE